MPRVLMIRIIANKLNIPVNLQTRVNEVGGYTFGQLYLVIKFSFERHFIAMWNFHARSSYG